MRTPYFKKGTQGRLKASEKNLCEQINKLVKENSLDLDELEVVSSEDELKALLDGLKEKYPSRPHKNNANDNDADDDDANDEFDNEELEESSSDTPASSDPKMISLSDFEPATAAHPFAESFESADMHKAHDITELFEDPELEEDGDHGIDSVLDPMAAWKSQSAQAKASNLLSSEEEEEDDEAPTKTPDSASTEKPKSSTEGDEEQRKAKLAEKTRKKATEMVVDKGARILEMVAEGLATWQGKFPEKKLISLEEQGLIDRHYIIDESDQKTLAQLVEEHNDKLEELFTTDEEQHDELVKAIALYLQEQEFTVSPGQNALITIATYFIGFFVEARKQRKKIDRLVKKVSDTYVLNVKRVAELEKQLKEKNEELLKIKNDQQPVNNQSDSAVRTLNFEENGKNANAAVRRLDLTETSPKRSQTEIAQATASMEEVNSPVEGDERPSQLPSRQELKSE